MKTVSSNTTRSVSEKMGATRKSPLTVLQERFGGMEQLVARRNSERVTTALRAMTEIRGCGNDDRAAALARLEMLPARQELETQLEELRAAVYHPAPEAEVRAILALMLEGIPAAASGATETYGDALSFAVIHADNDRDPDQFPKWRGLSAAVLFVTAQRIWRKTTFTPSIAEVLEVARKVRAEHFAALSATSRLLVLRENAEDVVDDTQPVEYSPADSFADPDSIPF